MTSENLLHCESRHAGRHGIEKSAMATPDFGGSNDLGPAGLDQCWNARKPRLI